VYLKTLSSDFRLQTAAQSVRHHHQFQQMRCRPATFASIADRQAAQQPEQQHRQELTENSMSPDAEQV